MIQIERAPTNFGQNGKFCSYMLIKLEVRHVKKKVYIFKVKRAPLLRSRLCFALFIFTVIVHSYLLVLASDLRKSKEKDHFESRFYIHFVESEIYSYKQTHSKDCMD